jgi:hypothetical protein
MACVEGGMSRFETVARTIQEHGPMTLDQVSACLPDWQRYQVEKALQNASGKKLIHVVDKVLHASRYGWVGVWAYTEGSLDRDDEGDPDAPRGKYGWIGRVSSVWELGAV